MTIEYSTIWKIDGEEVVIADRVNSRWHNRQANNLWWPGGKDWIVARLLVTGKVLDKIKAKATHKLVIERKDTGDPTKPQKATYEGLLWLKAQRLTPGKEDDDTALHLVELVDERYVWARFSTIDRLFNVREFPLDTPGTLEDVTNYVPTSLNSAAFHTWQTMFAAIWDALPTTVAAPTLPAANLPTDNPEDWKFIGETTWQALHRVLDFLGMTLLRSRSATYSVVASGADQELPDDEPNDEELKLNGEPTDYNATIFPETIVVHFPRFDAATGIDHAYQRTDDWAVAPSYIREVATNKENVIQYSRLCLWDSMRAMYTDSSTIDNQTQLNTRADEIAAAWLAAQSARTHKVLAGFRADYQPGSEIKAVNVHSDNEHGTTTEIVSYPDALDRPFEPQQIERGYVPNKGRRFRGLAQGAISAGSTGTVDNLEPIVGDITNLGSEVEVDFPNAGVDAADNAVVWVEEKDDGTFEAYNWGC